MINDSDVDDIPDNQKVFIVNKAGGIHHARFFARSLYAVWIWIHIRMILDFAAKAENKTDAKLQTIKKQLQDKDLLKRMDLFAVFSCIHLDYVYRSHSYQSIVNDYRFLRNIQVIMGKKWYDYMKTRLPGYYRNPELSILPIFTRNNEVASLFAKQLLKFEDNTRFLNAEEKTMPVRRYVPALLGGGKGCLHQPETPSPWCLAKQFVNNNNPINILIILSRLIF